MTEQFSVLRRRERYTRLHGPGPHSRLWAWACTRQTQHIYLTTTFLIFMSCLGMEPYIKVFKSLLHGVRGSDGSIHVYEGDTRMLCVSSCIIICPLGYESIQENLISHGTQGAK